ncbi:MAG: hypothetical protein ABIL09_02150, partial [Gemmatimonadota bacterium]
RNVSFGGQWLELRDRVRIGDLVHERNYVADEILFDQLRPERDADPYFLQLDASDPYERVTAADTDGVERFERGGNVAARGQVPAPGWRERDFRVERAVAEQIGFVQIPFAKIGLYCDEYRRELPAPEPLEE